MLGIRQIITVFIVLAATAAEATELRKTGWEEARITCKQVASCEEAVILWCNGYSRADGDGDGIPCENICHSLKQVNEIRNSIGC
ncbi:excalibur calcium-binding domain-containing protein [Rhizobium sp. L1K21]|uniref:excalibur calcium-binding domain-containing protein n=1 Tax=Rhizobium sp. L1K21 TaxID=2954933 RepID=UPI0020935557|nr:excalibur calcium-binding domain-containing protein [Rhizobium sp. L1K21]MCO6188020.1 excalibur calcium-binding domain-containing protein [Rhizobium sp. L1K21]